MSPERVQRMLVRLSCEIVERNRGASNVELVGIRRRGSAVAAAIAREMEVLEGRTFEVSDLDVSAYRDDRDPGEEIEDTSHMVREIADRDVVLVDDVLVYGANGPRRAGCACALRTPAERTDGCARRPRA